MKILILWPVTQKVYMLEGWNKWVHVAYISIKNILKNSNKGNKLSLPFLMKLSCAKNRFFGSFWRFSKLNIFWLLLFCIKNFTFPESPWKYLSNDVQFVGIFKLDEVLLGTRKISKIAKFRSIENDTLAFEKYGNLHFTLNSRQLTSRHWIPKVSAHILAFFLSFRMVYTTFCESNQIGSYRAL